MKSVLKIRKVYRNVRYYDFNQLKVKPCGFLDVGSVSQWGNTEKTNKGISLTADSCISFSLIWCLDFYKTLSNYCLYLYFYPAFDYRDIKIKLRVSFLERSTEIKLFHIWNKLWNAKILGFNLSFPPQNSLYKGWKMRAQGML